MMTMKGDNALIFLKELHGKCYAKFISENEYIRKYKAKIVGDEKN